MSTRIDASGPKPYARPRLRVLGSMATVTRKSGPVQVDNIQHPTRQN